MEEDEVEEDNDEEEDAEEDDDDDGGEVLSGTLSSLFFPLHTPPCKMRHLCTVCSLTERGGADPQWSR